MRLKSVTFNNFRCFESLTLDLHPRLTVIVGENGAGKTAVLDGIASGLTPLLTHLSSADQRLTGRGIKDADFRLQPYTGAGGKKHWGTTDYAQVMLTTWDDLRWDYWRPSGSAKGKEPIEKWGETALKEWLQTITASYKTETPELTPVFAYYGASRGRIEVPERLRSARHNYEHPTAALVDCFNPNSDFREMLAWYDLEESSELRENKNVADEDYAPFETLETVRATVPLLLGGVYRNPHFNNRHKFMLERVSDRAPLLVNQLSQGYQSMLAMALDFARRLAIANGHLIYGSDLALDQIISATEALLKLDASMEHLQNLPETLTMSAPAIMLVDEIDLHLHPSWQQRVLGDLMRAFPLTQFIVTTHSPQVLSTVKRENIRVLNGDTAGIPLASTYGQPSGDVMHSVMLVDPQPPIKEKQKIDRLTALVDQGHVEDEAQNLLEELTEALGPENARLQQLARSVQRQKLLRELSKQ